MLWYVDEDTGACLQQIIKSVFNTEKEVGYKQHSTRAYFYIVQMESLFSPLHCLLAHLNQAGLCLGIRKATYSLNSLIGIILRQSSRLLQTRAMKHNLSSLCNFQQCSYYKRFSPRLTRWTSPS